MAAARLASRMARVEQRAVRLQQRAQPRAMRLQIPLGAGGKSRRLFSLSSTTRRIASLPPPSRIISASS